MNVIAFLTLLPIKEFQTICFDHLSLMTKSSKPIEILTIKTIQKKIILKIDIEDPLNINLEFLIKMCEFF
jgi:hypothetical protein